MASKGLSGLLSDVISGTFSDREAKGKGPWEWVPGKNGKGKFKKVKKEKG